MFADLGFDTLTPQTAALWLALALGLAYGVLAQISQFCLRRGLVPGPDRAATLGTWAMALAVAILGTQAAVTAGWIAFDDHRLHSSALPLVSVGLGGLVFGAGMILTRGCLSRLMVLAGTGNMRALTVITLSAITILATMRGVLASVASSLAAVTVPLPELPSVWPYAVALAALALAIRSGAKGRLALGALIGLLVPLAWVGTGWVLFDDFDPIPMEGLAFTSPLADTLFYGTASTALTPGFGLGLVGGVIAGAFLAALVRGELQPQSFTSPAETARYALGAVLMGVGGVLAGGCTIGAGLSGIASGSLAALLALIAIAAGAWATNAALTPRAAAVPAE